MRHQHQKQQDKTFRSKLILVPSQAAASSVASFSAGLTKLLSQVKAFFQAGRGLAKLEEKRRFVDNDQRRGKELPFKSYW